MSRPSGRVPLARSLLRGSPRQLACPCLQCPPPASRGTWRLLAGQPFCGDTWEQSSGSLSRWPDGRPAGPRPRVTLTLLPWFSGWQMSPQDLTVAVLNFYYCPLVPWVVPREKFMPGTGNGFLCSRGRADGPLCGARMRTTWTRS